MKKIVSIGLLAISLLAFGARGLAADFKTATVDLSKVFDTYYKTVQASIAISNTMVERDKELNAMLDDRNKREDDWHKAIQEAASQAISPDKREEYKKEAENIALDLTIRNETISNFYARTEIKFHDDKVQHIKDLTAEIRGVMVAMAKRQGYTLLLDRTALSMTGNPLVLYTSGENDLTDALIKELNSTAPATPPPEPTSPDSLHLLPGANPGAPPARNPANFIGPLPGANPGSPRTPPATPPPR
jgi:Skp family chaperone for outer membrane proteins